MHDQYPVGPFAVGEIGIDLYWEQSTLPWQQEAFAQQILWAKKKFELPIVIHCRNSFDEIFEVLAAVKGPQPKGIFHCFSGTLEQAQHIIDLGLSHFGIGGVATFKNSKIDQFFISDSLEALGSPKPIVLIWLTPFRGKRNSAYIFIM